MDNLTGFGSELWNYILNQYYIDEGIDQKTVYELFHHHTSKGLRLLTGSLYR